MDYQKTEAGECTEENGNSSVEREESSIRSNSLTSSVSGDKNIVLSNCIFNLNIQEIKQPKRRAPLRKEDEAPPRKKKRAGSDKHPSDQGRKVSEETLPGTSGSAGTSGRGKKTAGKTKTSDTDKENKPKARCSKMSTLFNNVDKTYEMIRVSINDVEEEMSTQTDNNTQLPGVFRVFDATDWGYLKVFGKANKKKILKPGNSIEVFNVKADNRRELTCKSQDVRMSSKSVESSISIDKIEKEEDLELPKLSTIRDCDGFKKTQLIIFEVGEKKTKDRFGEFTEVIELKVKNNRKQTTMETLEAAAVCDYKVGQKIKIRVKYNRDENKFQTSNHCLVKKLSDL